LPSPNGGAVSAALADCGKPVLLGALRNATAVADAALALGPRVGFVACGERNPDGWWRPAEEDLLGLGAIANTISAESTSAIVAEALVAFESARSNLENALASVPSGVELIARGFGNDVRYAAQLDASATVPILRDGAFIPR
jgi:2-phosphosulfolactate phosphatase